MTLKTSNNLLSQHATTIRMLQWWCIALLSSGPLVAESLSRCCPWCWREQKHQSRSPPLCSFSTRRGQGLKGEVPCVYLIQLGSQQGLPRDRAAKKGAAGLSNKDMQPKPLPWLNSPHYSAEWGSIVSNADLTQHQGMVASEVWRKENNTFQNIQVIIFIQWSWLNKLMEDDFVSINSQIKAAHKFQEKERHREVIDLPVQPRKYCMCNRWQMSVIHYLFHHCKFCKVQHFLYWGEDKKSAFWISD